MSNPITPQWLTTALQRAEGAAEVTLPADQFKALCEMAQDQARVISDVDRQQWELILNAGDSYKKYDLAHAALTALGCRLTERGWERPCKTQWEDGYSGEFRDCWSRPEPGCLECGGLGWLPIAPSPPSPKEGKDEPAECENPFCDNGYTDDENNPGEQMPCGICNADDHSPASPEAKEK